MQQRPPAVAGSFYEARPERLRAQIQRCFEQNEPPPARQPFVGGIAPHAGLMYSGHVAALLYQTVDLPERLIILCPNHTGYGKGAAINSSGEWITPLGAVRVDSELAAELMFEEARLEEDSAAHAREHSLEVQLPFIQTIRPEARFVPVCIGFHQYGLCESIGAAVGRVIARHRQAGEHIGMIASSDMNHYQDQRTTLEKDELAIARILALDPRGLWEVILSRDISMCGILPAVAMLTAAKQLGATAARLLKHATSGDINGDYAAVVGYASIAIS